MDLNVVPVNEVDAAEEARETAVETMRREREERRNRLKRSRDSETGPEQCSSSNGTKMARPAVPAQASFREGGGGGSGFRGLHLPEGWADCPSMGDPIKFFVPAKVPLAARFDEVIPPGKRFSRTHVLRRFGALHREVGLVVDLTNTGRYYSPEEWTRAGVPHVKVPCRGRGAVPEPEAVNRFVFEMMKFQHRVAGREEQKFVLVHCTHGFNRTGFMIVHYLMRTQFTSVQQCVRMFAEARPPGIYKRDYIQSLFEFYNERRHPEAALRDCPPTPEWKKSSANGEAGAKAPDDEDDDDGAGGATMPADEGARLPPPRMTNDDVLGDAIPEEQQLDMQRYICTALKTSQGSSKQAPRFPGSQPVSLDRNNLMLLRQHRYSVTWKADGTRYMLFLCRDGCYLIDRNFRFRRVQIRFPVRVWPPRSKDRAHTPPLTPPPTHHLTLLDGEMVIDTLPGDVQLRRYLVYDMMILNEVELRDRSFKKRWELIKSEIYDPRSSDKQNYSARYMYENEKFFVRRKDFWLLSATKNLLTDFIPTLSHEADGLILQNWDDTYKPRTHEGLLKWKYARMNSVDFLFQISSFGQQQLLLMERDKMRRLEGAQVTFLDGQDPASFVGKIIECSWNPDEDRWEFMRVRVDKETPNAWHVYEKVMASLNDKITEDVLLEEMNRICDLPMYKDGNGARVGRPTPGTRTAVPQ